MPNIHISLYDRGASNNREPTSSRISGFRTYASPSCFLESVRPPPKADGPGNMKGSNPTPMERFGMANVRLNTTAVASCKRSGLNTHRPEWSELEGDPVPVPLD